MTPKPDSEKTYSLEKRVKKSRFNRPELLRILKNKDLFIKVIIDAAGTDEEMLDFANRMKVVWDEFRRLFSLAVQPQVKITETEWRD